jgi:hypothetical protein
MRETTDVRRTQPAGERPSTVRGQFDWSETEPTVAVVETVAAATDRTPLDVYSLHDTIETDALNDFLAVDGTELGADVQVSFSFDGCDVTVRADGLVQVELAGDY